MSITEPTPSQMAERFIQQRLREIVTRHEPLMDAAAKAIAEAEAVGRIDSRERERFVAGVRQTAIRHADALLRLRESVIEGQSGIGSLPGDIVAGLTRLRADEQAYQQSLDAIDDGWFHSEMDFQLAAMQAAFEGDIMPAREDYGLSPAKSIADGGSGDDE